MRGGRLSRESSRLRAGVRWRRPGSGLREFDALLQLSDWPGAVLTGDERFTPRDFHALFRRQRSLNFPPGTDWFYSNTGYVLLAEIVAKVTGRRFDSSPTA
jgi:CubicO group peptidase (beta-lactamase class C family)